MKNYFSEHIIFFKLLRAVVISGTNYMRQTVDLIRTFTHKGCVGVQIQIQMLSESDNFGQIRNVTNLQTRLYQIWTYRLLHKALIHRSSLSVVCHAEVNKCTLNSCLLMSV